MALYDDFGIPLVQEALGALDASQRGIAKRVSDQFDNSREIYNREANRFSLPAMADFNRNWAVERAKAMAGYSNRANFGDMFNLGGGGGASSVPRGNTGGGGGGGGGSGRGGGSGAGNGGASYAVPRGSPGGGVSGIPRVAAPPQRASTANRLGDVLGLSRMLFGQDPTSGTRGFQDLGALLYDLGLVKDPAIFARAGSPAEAALRKRAGYTPQQAAALRSMGIEVDPTQINLGVNTSVDPNGLGVSIEDIYGDPYGPNYDMSIWNQDQHSSGMFEGETEEEWMCRVYGICGGGDENYGTGIYDPVSADDWWSGE